MAVEHRPSRITLSLIRRVRGERGRWPNWPAPWKPPGPRRNGWRIPATPRRCANWKKRRRPWASGWCWRWRWTRRAVWFNSLEFGGIKMVEFHQIRIALAAMFSPAGPDPSKERTPDERMLPGRTSPRRASPHQPRRPRSASRRLGAPSLRFRGGPAPGAPLWPAGWPGSRPNSGTAKTGVVEAAVGAVRVAERRPHEARVVVPGPAAQDAGRVGVAA